jgi:hypothetical protein
MAKLVKIQVLGAGGEGLAGKPIKVTGCDELKTSEQGMTQFLVDSEKVEVVIGGSSAWSGTLADLKGNEIFQQNGSGFARK